MAQDNSTEEYNEGLEIVINFLKGQIGEYCNLENLLDQNSAIHILTFRGFKLYTDDIIKWLENNYSLKVIGDIRLLIEKGDFSIEQEGNNSSSEYEEITDEQFDILMMEYTSVNKYSQSDDYTELERRIIEEDYLTGESSSSDSE